MKNSSDAVLLIGLDGGAAIMNHHRPSVVQDDLLEGASGIEFNVNRIRRAWNKLQTYDRRVAFLRTHTESSDAPEPDTRAVECIARMVDAGYIRAIASTDTSAVLFNAFQDRGTYGADDRIRCADSLPDAMEVRERKKLFIDAGELLFNGFTCDRYGREGEALEKVREALKKLMGSYPRVYCWGWCQLNLDIKDVCPMKGLPYLTTIGHYTSASWSRSFNEVEREDDPYLATNDIWYDLDKLLFPHRPSSAKPGQSSRRQPRRPGPGAADLDTERTSLKGPLLSQETLHDLLKNAGGAAVSFVGVESASTRTRCAHWMATTLRQRRQSVLSCSSTDLEDLARFVTMISESKNTDSAWAVGVIGDVTGDTGRWSISLLPAVRRWRELAHQKYGQEDYHVVLFVPVAVVDWVTKQFPKEGRFWMKSFFTDDFLVPDVLAEWLVENVVPEVDELDSAGVATLALTMVQDPLGPRRADWLHEAIDLWYLEVLRRAQDPGALGDADGHEIDLGQLVNLWSGVRASYHHVVKELDVDFSIGPLHPRSETDADSAEGADDTVGDDPQSFPLGTITPHVAPGAGDVTSPEQPQQDRSDEPEQPPEDRSDDDTAEGDT